MATGRVPTTANSPLTAKGDLFGYSTTQARVPVGNDGETIVADSSTATGLKWAKSPNFVGCSVYLGASGGQQILTNATYTALTFDNEFFDTDGFHSNVTNNSRMTIPTGLGGKYRVTMNGIYNTNATGIRQFRLYKNGTFWYNSPEVIPSSSIFVGPMITFTLELVAGDYIEMYGYQSSGANLTIFIRAQDNPFTIEYLGA